MTTRGFQEAEISELAGWIADIIDNLEDEALNARVREQVLEVCKRFPVYA